MNSNRHLQTPDGAVHAGDELLVVDNLTIALPRTGDRRMAVDGISLQVRTDEIVCLVGESGSGKSMTAHAIMGLLPPRVAMAARSSIRLEGSQIVGRSEAQMQAWRGSRMGMVFQEPMSALNPLQRVGAQVAEALLLHERSLSAAQCQQRSLAMLDAVGLPDPQVLCRAYPMQLSGGQRQRVMIAMALINKPRLLIADEPTTALDVTTQAQILALIRRLQREQGMGVLFITHDIGVVADIADRVAVMRHGRIVESGTRDDVLLRPREAYTRTLIGALRGDDLTPQRATNLSEPLLRVRGLRKQFVTRTGAWGPRRVVSAAGGIDLDIPRGATLALVGESGSGKSTFGRMVMRLIEPDAGQVLFGGQDVLSLRGQALHAYRKRVQIIFQDPFASLNPRIRVGEAIARGMIVHGVAPAEARNRAQALLLRVRLDAGAAQRFPHEFSGGQRQRIAIARALALEPELLIADEAVSALDVSIQTEILQLLAQLKRELGLTMLFITHDLRVAGEIADEIVVMRRGVIVEQGTPGQVLGQPREAYTRELVSAIAGSSFLGLLPGTSSEPRDHQTVEGVPA